ncbi:MAG: ABC transporter permease, partial [Gemmatimonadota bacterium]|nr:ABC transporter permease [Gemmatimonadota bacterium]
VWGALSIPDFDDLASLGVPFAVTGIGPSPFFASVRHDDLTEVAEGEAVSGSFFELLGVEMSVGRGLSPDDDRPGAPAATVLSHDYWVRRYGADPSVPGRTILLNNEPYTIAGVAGPAFLGSSAGSRPQFWLPFEQFWRVYRPGPETRSNREVGGVIPIVRSDEGTSGAAVGDALDAFARSLDAEAPLADRSRRLVLERATWIRPEARDEEASTTRVLVAAAGFLLLLVCANVANLMLSAGARRQSEIAIRGALGASRGRVIRQLLTESLLLSVPAGVLALMLAAPASARLSSYFARPSVWGENVSREIIVDPTVVLFAVLAAVATGAAAALVPALRASERSPAAALGVRGEAAGGVQRFPGLRELLVSAQIAICVVLLFVAALVLRTLESASARDPGFDTTQTIASYVSTSSMGIPISDRHAFFEGLIRRFEELPWVEAATVSENAPLSGHPNQPLMRDEGGDPVSTAVARVWPGYFEVMDMEVREGRTLLATDTVDAYGVVVVNESFAARLAGQEGGVVGRRLVWPETNDAPDRSFEVVGVVRDASLVTLLADPGPTAYFSLPQHYSRPGNALLLKVRDDPARTVDMMERELRAVSPQIAIVNVLSYRDVVRGELYTQRMNAELFAVIAALGLLMSAAGVFGVMALAIAGRRREIGIRMAVGADGRSVAKAVLGPIGRTVLIGLGVGLLGALGATRLVEGLLWGVAPTDPASLAAGIGLLLIAVALAIGVPLSAALRIDPAVALRAE